MTEIRPNIKQQEAIDNLNGQIMLLAGPGTGKTFTIIHRIEKMLSEGIEPSSILCLTFSDAAANEMKQRLIKKMGVLASSVDIYTYHSFCNDIIKLYPSQFSLGVGVRLITETEKIKLMKDCIDSATLEYFVPPRADRYHFAGKFISYIEKLKSQRITRKDYFEQIETNPTLMPRIKELEAEIYERESRGNTRNTTRYNEIKKIKENIEKAKELWTLYELYSEKMHSLSLIDFSDMITFVLSAFEEDISFLREVSNKYKYFLVDEYQDTNDLQNEILFLLMEGNDNKNTLVVGDDDQIIYGFQGAKSDNIENFLTKYPDTKVICLDENNRSTQSILDFSYEVIQQDKSRLENNDKFKSKNIKKKLTAKSEQIIKKDKKIKRLQFGDILQEFNYIAEDIKNLVKSENCPEELSQIAIIAKKREELQTFGELLKSKNIPFQIDEGKSIFAIKSSIVVYFYLKALNNYLLSSDKLFGLILSEPFKIDLEDYNKILHEKRLLKKDTPNDFISLMKTLSNWKNPEKIQSFLDTFFYLQEYAATNDLRNTIIEILNRTGILEYYYKTELNRSENLLGIKKLLEEATDFTNLNLATGISDFVDYLDECLQNDIDICLDKDALIQNAVQLTTYHGSKGREFEYVYLPNLISKSWEDFRMPGEYKLITEPVYDKVTAQEKKDSELTKLLFVGITRAKHSLCLSFADMCDNKPQQITKYLADFTDYDFDSQQFEYKEDDFTKEFVRSISREVYDNKNAFKSEIEERVKNIVLSPSRLNDYLVCPRKFFYLKVLEIDVEEGDWDFANYGSIIHKLLENAVKTAKQTGKYPEIEEIKKDFQLGLDNSRFTSPEMKEKFEKQGNALIENYYPHFISIPISRIDDVEYTFNGVGVDKYTITGKIDRIEKNSDGTYELYDYKTGTPVSERKVAIGEDKENYYNQLCFYKYAFEKATGKPVSKVGLIYVENHSKNVYKSLIKEDMDYIENLIKSVYEKINTLQFDPIKEDKNGACKNCAYKHLCKLDII